MRTLLALVLLLVGPAVAYGGQKPLVQLTSVTVAGSSSRAELTVRQGPVDLADLAITDLDGTATPLSESSKSVPTGTVIRLHWEKAVSPAAGSIPVPGHVLSSTDDQLAVLYEDAHHDAVVWSNGDGAVAQAEITDVETLVSDGMWKGNAQSDAVPLSAGTTFIRTTATDTNTKADWRPGGGSTGGDDPELPGAGASDLVLFCAAGVLVLRGGGKFLRRFLG